MFKSLVIIHLMLITFITLSHGKVYEDYEAGLSSTVKFIKPSANAMRRLNPLKLLFTVAYVPTNNPPYSVEWNFDVLKTMLLESSYVDENDKNVFIDEYYKQINDYPQWSSEKKDELERFTEKYFNIYKSSNKFLPFLDCRALTYGLTDEMIRDLRPTVSEQKREEICALTTQRLCSFN